VEKIPTVFRRDPENMRRVLPEVTPGCEWVLAGEGVATRKYDGTCVMFDGEEWWARREVKPGKAEPADFRAISTDPATGRTVGWVPIGQSSFAKFWRDAWTVGAAGNPGPGPAYEPGTYELCGPKVQGNPEEYDLHVLIRHEDAEVLYDVPRDFETLAGLLVVSWEFEGIVWHHPDGRMAKLKGRDFGNDGADADK
jgi:hypothetical protein